MRLSIAIARVLLALAFVICIFGFVILPFVFIITAPPGVSDLTMAESAKQLDNEYSLQLEALQSDVLRQQFVQSALDRETASFISQCVAEWTDHQYARALKDYR